MANKTFVAKNGLTANTANVFMSQLSGTLTPTAAGAIVIVDGTGQLGTRTEAQILSDIGAISSSSAVDSVTAGNGLTGGGTEGDVTVTLGTPATLTVSGTNTVGGTDHQHAITTSADTSSGTQAILASDSSGDLKVANFQTGAALTVGTDLVVKDDISLDSDGAVLGFGDDNEITLTHVHDSGLTLNGASKINFGDTGTFIHQSADGVLDLVSDTELELNATTIDINGAVEMSGVVTVATGIIADAQDGAYLGSTTKQFSDLYLADGAQILFGDDSEVTLTHNADKGLTLKHTATAGAPTLTLAAGDTNIAVNDVIGAIDFVAPDEGTGTDAITTAGSIRVISEGDFAADNNASKMSFMLGASGAASEVMSLSSGGNLTVNGDLIVSGTTTTVNSTTVSIADPIFELGEGTSDDNLDRGIKMKYNSSGAKIAFMGFDDSDGKFTMIPDATDSTSVFSGTVGTLKANLEGTIQTAAQGNITSLGTLTGLTIANGGNIGSAGDTDAIAIDSSGNVTISQNLTVQGTTTTQDSQTLTVSANLIEVNTGLSGANSNDSGLVIERGSTGDNAIMMWDESADKFQMGTTTATSSSTGNLTVTTGTLVANIEGNLTGTIQTAAQTNITSLGTLTALTVDNVAIDGSNIGHTSDTDLMTLASGVLTVNGEISVTTLDIGGTNVGSTADELNKLDGSAKSTTSITIDDSDAFIIIDGNDTKQIPASNIKTYAAAGVTVQEEGSSLSTAGTTLNFVGDTVTATGSGATKTITVADESLINAIIFG